MQDLKQPVSKSLEDFLTFLRESKQNFNIALDEERDVDNMANDFNHAVEFGCYNPDNAAALLERFSAIRKESRKAKQIIETTKPVCDWIGEHHSCIKSLENLLGSIRSIEERARNRVYVPRTDFME